MERVIKLLSSAVIFFSLSSPSEAVPFNEMDNWQPDIRYHRGDIIAEGYDVYVNVIPVKGLYPEDSRFAWRKVNYKHQLGIGDRRLFFPGQVVAYDDKYFISRRINVIRRAEVLTDERRWLEFTHPGLIYDLPDPDDDTDAIDTLLGIDSNGNSIRDDYEIAIAFSDLPEDVVDSALSAGKVYGQLMASGTADFVANQESAASILKNLYVAEQCKRQHMRENGGYAWPEATYFNTFDRIEAKFKLQGMLVSVLGDSPIELPEGEPCILLNSI